MKNLLLDKRNLFTISFLVFVTIVANILFFSKQLNYGFRDVDWMVLYYFKVFGNLSLNHLLQEIKVLGVYIPESYYVGLLEKFLGLNFANLHQMTHVFKIISAISVYLLILAIFKKRLLAFITSLVYTISYTHAGPLFQLSSGAYFLTFIFMNLFLIAYYYSLTSENFLKQSVVAGILLIITMVLKPERMYPLIALVFIVEFFIIVLGKFKKPLLNSLKRTLLIFLPLIILYPLLYILFTKEVPAGFAPNQFSLGVSLKFKSILDGNLQLLIEPFASLGSIFLFEDYWKLMGQLNFQSFPSFVFSLIFGPILRLALVTFLIFSIIFGRTTKFVLTTSVTLFIFGLIIYALSTNWQNIDSAKRIHFDSTLITMPAIFGFYILILSFLIFIKWLKSKDWIMLSPVGGIVFAFLFILLTWVSSDIVLIFMGPQRYLSIPSIGTSLFIAGILVIVFNRLREIKFTRQFARIIFLILIPLMVINYRVANKFFDYELTYAGLRGSEQIRMKSKFRQLVGQISQEDRSLFYFDETADKENGYFDEGTVEAGFEFWTRINSDGTLNNFPEPGMMRTNTQCPEHTHQNCIKILKEGLKTENGQVGIWYKDPIRGNVLNFYKLNNFYAYRFINKDIFDIKEEVLREFGL